MSIFYVYLKYRISGEVFFGYYFKYFITTFLFFIISIIIILLKKEHKVNIFLSFLSLLFIVYSIETFLFKTHFLDKPNFQKEKIELINKKKKIMISDQKYKFI